MDHTIVHSQTPFMTLSKEIITLIAEEILAKEDCSYSHQLEAYRVLAHLTLTCKAFYLAFNGFLYENITTLHKYFNAGIMKTLALSDEERGALSHTLRSPHPASFVKYLQIVSTRDLFIASSIRARILSKLDCSEPREGGLELDETDWADAEREMERIGKTEGWTEEFKRMYATKSQCEKYLQTLARFQNQIRLVLHNIAKHGSALYRLEIRCELAPLPFLFERSLDLSRLSSLRELVLGPSFPQRNLGECLVLLEKICSTCRNLVSLELNWDQIFMCAPRPDISSQVLSTLPKNCPGLEEITLRLKSSEDPDSCVPLQQVFDSPDFVFPKLNKCHLYINEIIDLTAFFLRHPAIQYLNYYNRFHEYINDPRFGKRLEPGQVFLPNLTYFEGFALNFVAICCSDPNSESVFPPLDTVEINLDEEEERLGSEDGLELQVAFVDALRSTSLTVKKLSLWPNFDIREDRGLPLDVIIAIIQACPGLTHFECTFDAFDTHAPYKSGHQSFYNSILSHLPLLESLTVYYEYAQDSFDILSAEALRREKSIHCEAILNSLMYTRQKHASQNRQTINQDGFAGQDDKQGDRRGDMQDDELRLERVEVLARMVVRSLNDDSDDLQERRFCFVYEDGGIVELNLNKLL
ncbi:hypothetical protein F5050DRAFT_1745121 [Lentinula boryana]|uniref:F-box domain-containing protein n=1 Tax=Lentinula boryana TaxID=40481 RepID=A0ABQ8QIK9_9AGAR|nr:hypothetical protein F5050DRAFT_1745121 [Lentinula boryana]